MKLPAILLATAALAGLAACQETQTVANQFEKTTNEMHNTVNAIETVTENNIRAAEDALDQDWQNKSIDVNVTVSNKQ